MKIYKVFLVFIGLFTIGELTCRILMPSYVTIIDNKTNKRIWLSEVIESSHKGKRFKPNLDLSVYNAWISYKPRLTLKTNSLGFRGPEINSQDTEQEFRILLLGDSITWAGYLPEEETYVFQLQQLLNLSLDTNIRTINAGIGDVGIDEEVEVLKDNFAKIKPGMVIVVFYLNDSRPSLGFDSEKKLWWAKFLQKSRFIDTLYNNAQIQLFLVRQGLLGKGYRYRWFYLSRNPRWKTDKVYFQKMVQEADLDWGAAWIDAPWNLVAKNIEELKNYSIENGFKLMIVCLPVSFQVYTDFIDNNPQKKLMLLAQNQNIPFLDLLPKLRENSNKRLFFDHCHLNTEGQYIVAKEMADYILANKLVP